MKDPQANQGKMTNELLQGYLEMNMFMLNLNIGCDGSRFRAPGGMYPRLSQGMH